MKFFSMLKKSFKRNRTPKPAMQQANWGQAFQQVESIYDGFRKVAELTGQYQGAMLQGFDKIIALAGQYHNSAIALRKNLTTFHEQSTTTKERYKKLLCEIAELVDYCDQVTSSKEVLQPVINQAVRLLASHGVTSYMPEEGKPADYKYCVVEVPVPSEDKPPGLVVKVISKGYLWRDVTLIPAKVVATTEPVRAPQPDAVAGEKSADSQSDKNVEKNITPPPDKNTTGKGEVEERS
jgi:molecular chaperone GrpE (heat shock protein)